MAVAFTIPRAVLLPLVDAAKKAIKKSNMPVLNNVLITAEGETVEVMGTDLVMTVAGTGKAEITEPGRISVEADLLLNTIRRMPEGEIRIEEAEGRMTVKGGKASGRLYTLLPEDHARVDQFTPSASFEIASTDLAAIADSCTFAMSSNEVRVQLCGVYLHVEDGKLRAVASDGTVFSKLEMDVPEGAAAMPGIIVPDAMVKQLPLLAGRKGLAAKVDLSDSSIAFAIGDLRITSRLIDATFVPYQRFLPVPNEAGVVVDTAAFKGAVDRMLLYSPEGEHKYRDVKCVFGEQSVQMLTRSDKGEAQDEVEIESDVSCTVGWNSRRLLDVLNSIKGERIRLEPGEPGRPTRIVDLDDATRELVIMPIALHW